MPSSRTLLSSPRRIFHRYTSSPFSKSPPPIHIFTQSHSTYNALIENYRFSRSLSEAKHLHLNVIKHGFTSDLYIGNTLINVYLRPGELLSAHKVFDEMPVRNSVTWACLISGYTNNNLPNDAFAAFIGMLAAGFFANHYALGSTLRACQRMGSEGLRRGVQLHGLVSKTIYAHDVVVCNVLITMYGSCSTGFFGIESAQRVFDGITNKNSISWNSIISVYCQRGDVDFAFSLFSGMLKEGFGFSFQPTEYTFASLVSAAAESSDLSSGSSLLLQLLAKIEKSGLVEDLYVGSALVSGFAKIGCVEIAKGIFRLMGTRNAVSVNGMMVGLVKLGLGEEAVDVLLETRDFVRLNDDSYIHLLGALGEFSCLEEGKRKGKEIHAYLTRSGISDSSVAVGNGLISMYAKCDAIEEAYSVFKLMPGKDSVSWSSMISAFDQNEHFEDALLNLIAMKRNGVTPTNFTLISVASSCSSLRWVSTGEQIHCEATKLGLNPDVSVSNSLLSLYADAGHFAECRKLFSSMPHRDQVSWNSIVGSFNDDSKETVVKAAEYFVEMMRAGWNPNSIKFINVLAASASLSCAEFTRQVHALVLKHRLAGDNTINNSLVTCYGKCGEINDCERVFYGISERDYVSWNSMISGYIHNEKLSKAMELIWLMLHNGQKLDHFTFAMVLSACASVATLDHGMEVHGCATRACLVSDVVIGSALVDMYAKCGRIDYASQFFELMPLRNVYTWNSMISGYARHGDGLKALDVFTRMKQESQRPDHVTFVGVLSACSHMGLMDEGYNHFNSMSKTYGLTPKIEHYCCMVDLLGRAGDFGKLEEFINQMPIEPNVLLWRTVLGACGRANGQLLQLGRKAAKKITEMEPKNAVNYVLISNMYASSEKWEHMTEAREAMKNAAGRKEAGCSWVTMKDGIHVFVSGDKVHPEKDAIYNKIGELHRKMKSVGYVAQVGYALHDLEAENKEEVLRFHSERLAVAFVLLREARSRMAIRIMKNLRVCGDCHSAFKYISKIVGRKIVLRDSNRFHHFENGKCSCNDYW